MAKKTTDSDRKRTPSARVIAAKWIVDQLDVDEQQSTLLPEQLSELADSRVSDKKAEQVLVFIDKLANKYLFRMSKIVSRFENPPPPKGGKRTPPKVSKKKKQEEEEE